MNPQLTLVTLSHFFHSTEISVFPFSDLSGVIPGGVWLSLSSHFRHPE